MFRSLSSIESTIMVIDAGVLVGAYECHAAALVRDSNKAYATSKIPGSNQRHGCMFDECLCFVDSCSYQLWKLD